MQQGENIQKYLALIFRVISELFEPDLAGFKLHILPIRL